VRKRVLAKKGAGRPGCWPPGSQTRSSRDIYSSRTPQLPQTAADTDSRSLGERPPGCRHHPFPQLQTDVPRSASRSEPTESAHQCRPLPASPAAACLLPAALCAPVSPLVRTGAFLTMPPRPIAIDLSRHEQADLKKCYFFCYSDFFYHSFLVRGEPLKGRPSAWSAQKCGSAALIRAPAGRRTRL